MFNIYRAQDIHIDDYALKREYYNDFLLGRVADAHNLYTSHPELNGKCLSADMLNQLLNSLLSLEGNFDEDVIEELDNLYNSYQLDINEILYMNEYSASEQYTINNFVIYNDEVYFCILTPPIGTHPTEKLDNQYWIYVGLKGQKGSQGLGINYVGAWVNTKTYIKFDMVVYQNKLYVAKQSNTNQLPTNTTYWGKVVDILPTAIHVSSTEPSGLMSGDIWFKIL